MFNIYSRVIVRGVGAVGVGAKCEPFNIPPGTNSSCTFKFQYITNYIMQNKKSISRCSFKGLCKL